jgi:HPt (histidine-containing phosphotransfer) domain-containing protein
LQQPTLDQPDLDVATGLANFGGDRKTYGDLLQQFADQHAADVETARQLLSAGNPRAAAQRMHTLAGISSFLRATLVAALAEACERALLHDVALASDTLLTLEIAMRRLAEAIAQFRQESTPATA